MCSFFVIVNCTHVRLAALGRRRAEEQIKSILKEFTMKLNRLLIALGAFIALLCQSSTAEALIADIKGTGMAAAVTAYPQSTLSSAYNPAGLVEIGNRIDIGTTWAHYRGTRAFTATLRL